jgi:hypothetical protein
MEVNYESKFTEWLMTGEEIRSALLAAPCLLPYLHSKQARTAEEMATMPLIRTATGVDLQASMIEMQRLQARMEAFAELIEEIHAARNEAETADTTNPSADDANLHSAGN